MQLVESRTGNLPVRFLVQVAQCHRVGKDLIELCRHFQPYRLLQFKRQKMVDGSVCLNLSSSLVKAWLCGDFSSGLVVGHKSPSGMTIQNCRALAKKTSTYRESA